MITTNITEAVRGEFKKKGMQNYDLIKAVKDENGDMRALTREVYHHTLCSSTCQRGTMFFDTQLRFAISIYEKEKR